LRGFRNGSQMAFDYFFGVKGPRNGWAKKIEPQ
jgi:hypothetical protein